MSQKSSLPWSVFHDSELGVSQYCALAERLKPVSLASVRVAEASDCQQVEGMTTGSDHQRILGSLRPILQ